MEKGDQHVYPKRVRSIGRESKERLLGQRGSVFWMYGLSGAGKSTLVEGLEQRLYTEGCLTEVLDGDRVRSGLTRDLGFSDADRYENIRRVAEVARLFKDSGVIVLAAFITPTREMRALARSIIGSEDFREVYLKCSLEACAQRDVKGLYARAKAGDVAAFTGYDSIFEEPERGASDMVLDTEALSVAVCVDRLYGLIAPFRQLPNRENRDLT